MKRLLILLLFCLIPIFGGTTEQQTNPYLEQLKREVVVYNWKATTTPGKCVASFQWLVSRLPNPDYYGNYVYKIYFYSTSQYCDGSWASTYISGVTIFVNGVAINPNPNQKLWIMFRDVYANPSFSFTAGLNVNEVRLSWQNITVN